MTLYFVVKNFGSTTARNVKVTTDKPIRRSYKSGDDYEVFKLFEELPVMVPGQEWRTFLDASLQRFNNDDLKMETYEATATYRDSRGKKLTPDKFKLDWTTFHEMEFEQKADIGDLAKSVEKIKDVVGGWSERTGKGLAVFTRNGKAKDDQWTADLLARRQKLAEQQTEEAAYVPLSDLAKPPQPDIADEPPRT